MKMSEYDPERIENKWQEKWEQENLYETPDNPDSANAMYVLGMFPYPSGSGLHVGHVESFAGTDVYARFQRMQGNDVLFPMGWDAFGLPAENYAIKTGTHPRERTEETIPVFKNQLESLGLSYDWGREINTSEPEYYKWTQWLFTTLFEDGLAEKKPDTVNWCPSCQTVLANAQVIDDLCERCDTEVVEKEMDQWFFKIREYADELIDDLDDLDWPESTKELQRNWIGRQDGAVFNFPVHDDTKRRYVILHGYKSGPDKHFHPWLKKKLESLGNEVVIPELPNPDDPDISEQVRYVRQNVELTEDTILVGHSLGTIVAMKVLENLDHHVRSTYLVAPYVDTDFADGKKRGYEDTTEWGFNTETIQKNAGQLINLRPQEDTSISDDQYERAKDELGGTWTEIDVNKPHAKGEKEPALLSHVGNQLAVFTTRPDTLFGVTYLAVAPESTWVENLIEHPDLGLKNRKAVKEYVQKAKEKTNQERQEAEDKTGVKLEGITVEHSATGENLPVYVADYVLPDYGTGKIMAVPAHDERDFQFAKRQDLPIQSVVKPNEEGKSDQKEVYTGRGKLINSDEFSGLESDQAADNITTEYGQAETTYQLRDWSIGRQRFWGAPIPIVYDPDGNPHPVPDEHLPWELPDDVAFEPTGEPPLAKSEELQQRTEEIFGEGWTPETETMDTFVDSSWYFLRYPDPQNDQEFAGREALDTWCPVDMYIGGAEHAVLHLLYARFITKALADAGAVDFREPFASLRHQGMVLAEDGTKMSKSKGNVVNPNEVVDQVGADTLRMYELFAGPFSESFDWDTDAIAGPRRFIERVWRLFADHAPALEAVDQPSADDTLMHQTVRDVTEDIADFKFNTAISALMEARNDLSDRDSVSAQTLSVFVRLLAPFAPHATEELWELYGGSDSVHKQDWPTFAVEAAEEDTVDIAVQIDGTVRGEMTIDKNTNEAEVVAKAKRLDNVQKYLQDITITRHIYVPEQLINFVSEK
jgi:leucyl-tRNA synthetase